MGTVSWCLLDSADKDYNTMLDSIRSGIWIKKYSETSTCGIEHDEYDDTAKYLALVKGATVLGGSRLIRANGNRLPIAQVSNEPIDEGLCEISRFCILESSFPDIRDTISLMIPGLTAVQTVISARGENVVYANARQAFTRVWERMGVSFRVIGETNEHNGFKFTPVSIDLSALNANV